MNAAEIIAGIHKQRGEIALLIAGATEAQMAQRLKPDWSWTSKDLIAHIVYWEARTLDLIRHALRGEDGDFSDTDIDGINEHVYQENLNRSLADILAEFEQIGREVIDQIGALSDDDLNTPGRFQIMRGAPLIEAVAGDTYEHYPEHIDDLRAWRSRINNVKP